MRRRLLILLGVSLLILMLAVVPFMAACEEDAAPPANGGEEDVTPPANGEEEPPEVIELTYGSGMGPTMGPEPVIALYLDKIEEETNGQVHFERYYGGALCSIGEGYQECAQGICDLTSSTPGYSAVGYDIGKAAMTFIYDSPDMETALRIYHEIREKFPEVTAETDDVKWLYHYEMPPYQLLTTTAVRSIDDIQGLSIRGTAGLADWLTALGAEGVGMPGAELYLNLEKGIIDGTLYHFGAIPEFNFQDIIKYVTVLNFFVWPCPGLAMNLDAWNSLPTEIQQVFEDNESWAVQEQNSTFQNTDIEAQELCEDLGIEIIELSAEELAEFYELLTDLNEAWAADLDARGLPGTEVLEECRHLIEEYS
jgi:TRAP-type C4-dicarboxylate transport system substrate-binding protein